LFIVFFTGDVLLSRSPLTYPIHVPRTSFDGILFKHLASLNNCSTFYYLLLLSNNVGKVTIFEHILFFFAREPVSKEQG
jgi:hypothetical protein